MTMELQKLIHVWSLSSKHHLFSLPATEHDLQLAEAKLGQPLPIPLRELYLFSNGMNLLNGNLQILPLEGAAQSMGLLQASAQLREWHWQIPREVLVFGDNGADEELGIWLPELHSSIFKHPVLMIAETSTPQNMGILATDLVPFLFGWTAYYLMLYDAEGIVLDALGVPRSLRYKSNEMDDGVFAQLRQWADPGLPDPYPDTYRHAYDVEGLNRLFGA